MFETIDLGAAVEGLCLPDRDHLSRATGRLSRRRGADHIRRPRGRWLEDESRLSPRSGVEGAAAAAHGARWEAVISFRASVRVLKTDRCHLLRGEGRLVRTLDSQAR